MTSYDFGGKVALITGGASGIGLATARAFARARAKLVLIARGEQAGRAACAELRRAGASALFVAADVRDEMAVARAVNISRSPWARLAPIANPLAETPKPRNTGPESMSPRAPLAPAGYSIIPPKPRTVRN
jgi:NAD(P)-dependent dehydrogenase (short-subunit alcohol dehydrogenase family)